MMSVIRKPNSVNLKTEKYSENRLKGKFFFFLLGAGLAKSDHMIICVIVNLWCCDTVSAAHLSLHLCLFIAVHLYGLGLGLWMCLCFVINWTFIESPTLPCTDCIFSMALVCMLEEGKVFHDDWLFLRRRLGSWEPSAYISLSSIFSRGVWCISVGKQRHRLLRIRRYIQKSISFLNDLQ